MTSATQNCHSLIIGSGAAGLTLALRLAEAGRAVTVLSKAALSEGSTLYAQGGISAVLDAGDSISAHIDDTLTAGAGLCDERAVRFAVEHGRQAIEWLIARGVPFTPAEDETGYAYHLAQEGGHSHRRIIHAADATGRAVENTLEGLARANPLITVLEHQVAIDLICETQARGQRRCVGLYALDRRAGRVGALTADQIVLATGGANLAY
ncbi:MAG: FAD-dependent oxidoreductase, partial [Salinisphaera sp.]|nr:FAD-dependent oxidoreductase [Salinisphaera sp.]